MLASVGEQWWQTWRGEKQKEMQFTLSEPNLIFYIELTIKNKIDFQRGQVYKFHPVIVLFDIIQTPLYGLGICHMMTSPCARNEALVPRELCTPTPNLFMYLVLTIPTIRFDIQSLIDFFLYKRREE